MKARAPSRRTAEAPHDDRHGAADRKRRRDDDRRGDDGDASDPDTPIPPDPGKVTDFELDEEDVAREPARR